MAKQENPLAKFMDDISVAASGMVKTEKDRERILLMAMRATEGVLEQCTAKSIAESIIQGFSLNLDPNPNLGQLHFVPYKRRCCLQVGYKGWVQLASRSGIVLWGDVIREKDDYSFRMGSNPKIDHTYNPSLTDEERGPVVGSYCVWAYAHQPEIRIPTLVGREDLDKARKMASPKSPAWNQWYNRMAIKTAINRAANTMPLSTEMALAQSIDAEFNEINSVDYVTHDEGGKTVASPRVTAEIAPAPEQSLPEPTTDAQNTAQESSASDNASESPAPDKTTQAAQERATVAKTEATAPAPAAAQGEIMATEETISAIANHSVAWDRVSPAMQKAMRKRQNDPAFDFSPEKLAGLTEESARKLLAWLNQQANA